jgi:hypothetical protein
VAIWRNSKQRHSLTDMYSLPRTAPASTFRQSGNCQMAQKDHFYNQTSAMATELDVSLWIPTQLSMVCLLKVLLKTWQREGGKEKKRAMQ